MPFSEISHPELKAIVQSEGMAAIRQIEQGVRLSLAGAHSKLPIVIREEEFYLPSQGAPSTHILKFNRRSGHYPRLIENEFFVTRLAHHVGLSTVACSLRNIEGEIVFVSPRYDRDMSQPLKPRRIHQEDFCQALGLSHRVKYEKEGGLISHAAWPWRGNTCR